MKATIHQPDFMPWFGFFNKISKCDVWVLLDHVENNPRDAAFWGRRVRILVNGHPSWLSIPLKRPAESGRIGVPIAEMEINLNLKRDLENCLRTVKMAYGKSPFYAKYIYLAEQYFMDAEPLLINRNMRFISEVLKILRMNPQIISSSTLNITSKGTQLLIDILTRVSANEYICGGGASEYQRDNLFSENNIKLTYNDFQHPSYAQSQSKTFVGGLSILDMLFNLDTVAIADALR